MKQLGLTVAGHRLDMQLTVGKLEPTCFSKIELGQVIGVCLSKTELIIVNIEPSTSSRQIQTYLY
jgi:hypothetical protein